MKFEEALKLMREGKKIRNPFMKKDEYFMACRVGLIGDDTPLEEKPISIVKMKGKCQHPDMMPLYAFPSDKCSINPRLHSYPQLNLLLIMQDNWEAFD